MLKEVCSENVVTTPVAKGRVESGQGGKSNGRSLALSLDTEISSVALTLNPPRAAQQGAGREGALSVSAEIQCGLG